MNVLDLREKKTERRSRPSLAPLVFAALFVLGIVYLIWLDSGCGISGIMTSAGKVCIN